MQGLGWGGQNKDSQDPEMDWMGGGVFRSQQCILGALTGVGYSREGKGSSFGLACCQVWGDNQQGREPEGEEDELSFGHVQFMILARHPSRDVRRQVDTSLELGGGLNGEANIAVIVSGWHRKPGQCLLTHGRHRIREMRTGTL